MNLYHVNPARYAAAADNRPPARTAIRGMPPTMASYDQQKRQKGTNLLAWCLVPMTVTVLVLSPLLYLIKSTQGKGIASLGVANRIHKCANGNPPLESYPQIFCRWGNNLCRKPEHELTVSQCDARWLESLKAPVRRVNWRPKGANEAQWLGTFSSFTIDLATGQRAVAALVPNHRHVTSIMIRHGHTAASRSHSFGHDLAGAPPAPNFTPYRVAGKGGGNAYAFHVDRVVGFHRTPASTLRYFSFNELAKHLLAVTTDDTALEDGEPMRIPITGDRRAGPNAVRRRDRRRLQQSALARPLAGDEMPLLEENLGSDAEQMIKRQAASEALAAAREANGLNLPEAPAARRVTRMLRLLRKRYSSNDTHALIELTALVPSAPLRFPKLTEKSPLVGDDTGEFWEYVSNPLPKDETLEGTSARLSSDKDAAQSLQGINAKMAKSSFEADGIGLSSRMDTMQKKYVGIPPPRPPPSGLIPQRNVGTVSSEEDGEDAGDDASGEDAAATTSSTSTRRRRRHRRRPSKGSDGLQLGDEDIEHDEDADESVKTPPARGVSPSPPPPALQTVYGRSTMRRSLLSAAAGVLLRNKQRERDEKRRSSAMAAAAVAANLAAHSQSGGDAPLSRTDVAQKMYNDGRLGRWADGPGLGALHVTPPPPPPRTWNDFDSQWYGRALELVDMQIFDYLTGNDDRVSGNIARVDDANAFLLFLNNSAAGNGVDDVPEIKRPYPGYRSPNLFLGVIGCRFRKRTVDHLREVAKMRLSSLVRASLSADAAWNEHHNVLAHSYLMSSIVVHPQISVDLRLDEHLNRILSHVDKCLKDFPKKRGYQVIVDL